MQQSKRALVAAVTVTIAFGFTAPQASATPHSGHGQGHAAHATAHGKGSHGAQAAGADHKLTNAQRKVAKEAGRKDKALERCVTDRRLSHLSAETADAVRANVAEDRTSLAALAAEAAAATTADDLAAVAEQVHAVRPEGYRRLVNLLGHAGRIQAHLDAALAADPAADTAAAQALVDSAVEKALAYRASDPKSALSAIQRDVAGAQAALDATADDTTDDTTDDPADGTGDGTTDGTGDGSTDPVDPAA